MFPNTFRVDTLLLGVMRTKNAGSIQDAMGTSGTQVGRADPGGCCLWLWAKHTEETQKK